MAHASEKFTTPGRLLVFLSLMAALGATVLLSLDFILLLPSGRYPRWIVIFPGLAAGGGTFAIGAILFRILGWRFLKGDKTDDPLDDA
jgi:membrane protein implicated in regulation of membrane protease activity